MWVLSYDEAGGQDLSEVVLELYSEKANACKRLVDLLRDGRDDADIYDDVLKVIEQLVATMNVPDRGFAFDVFTDEELDSSIRGYILAADVRDA